MPPQHTKPLTLAAAVAILTPPTLYSLLALVSGIWGGPGGVLFGFVIGVPLSLGCMLVGAPVVWALRRWRWLSSLTICIAAMLIGAGLMHVLFYNAQERISVGAIFGGVMGLFAGIAFSWVAGTRFLPVRP